MLRLFINLTPFIPLSLKGEGEDNFERETNVSLKHSLVYPLQRIGKEILERGETPL